MDISQCILLNKQPIVVVFCVVIFQFNLAFTKFVGIANHWNHAYEMSTAQNCFKKIRQIWYLGAFWKLNDCIAKCIKF